MKALVVVNAQNEFIREKQIYNKDVFIQSVKKAVIDYRESGYLVFFIQHTDSKLIQDSDDWKIYSDFDCSDSDIFIQKNYIDAFDKTRHEWVLHNKGVDEIAVCGLHTHQCIKKTCVNAVNKGFVVTILHGAHSNCEKNAAELIEKTEKELQQIGVRTAIVPIH
jgi:nicotinamidase-related amidase